MMMISNTLKNIICAAHFKWGLSRNLIASYTGMWLWIGLRDEESRISVWDNGPRENHRVSL